MKQTAVDYLVEQLERIGFSTNNIIEFENEVQISKEMEKEQLLDMGNQFAIMGEDNPEQYYNETYKSE